MKIKHNFFARMTSEGAFEPGGGASAQQEHTGTTTGEVDILSATAEQPQLNEWQQSIPYEYKDANYLEGVDSLEKLLKQHDNVQKLIGKKTIGVPDSTASAEEWNEYYNKIRPETADKYELKKFELPDDKQHYKDIFDTVNTEEVDKQYKEIAHKHGLSAEQAAGLYQDMNNVFLNANDTIYAQQIESLKEAQQAKEESTRAFQKIVDEKLGDGQDKAIDIANKMMQDAAPDLVLNKLTDLPPELKAAMAVVLSGVHKKYVAEDGDFNQGDTPFSGSLDQLYEQRMSLMAERLNAERYSPKWTEANTKIEQLNKVILKQETSGKA